MTDLRFTIPGPPIPKARPRLARNGHTYTPGSTRAFEATVRAYAYQALGKANLTWGMLGDFAVELAFYLPDKRRKDCDNLGKGVADALNGVIWQDDSQITDMSIHKRFDAKRPRTEVVIRHCYALSIAK
jgi:Holliday junction resolvase RusA-like endonuclease